MTNKTYIKYRTALIPEAERLSNEKYGIKKYEKTSPKIRAEWSRSFFMIMDELAVRDGLCEAWVLEKYR